MNSQPEGSYLASIIVFLLTLSTGILREMFKSCLDTRYPHVQPFLPTEALMLLCRVCVLWRTIAITTSELWAGLSVSIGREMSEEPQPWPELIKIWMARSGCQPLTLILKELTDLMVPM